MLMTINRCLDYTKASRGLKLAPKYETVDLMETLSMPLQCMKNIQDRIGIEMEEIGPEICSHVITDKQWLQENILCLLSNAVKYSSEGIVTISVSLKVCPVSEVTEREEANRANFAEPKSKSVAEKPLLRMVTDAGFLKVFSANSTKSRTKYVVPVSDQNDIESSKSQSPSKPINSSASESTLRTSEHHRYLRFEISDHGIGLTEEGMKNLFNPFQQAQKLAGGTGMIFHLS
jgi:signal transduction histidine kinase